jgi:hypothetical protein
MPRSENTLPPGPFLRSDRIPNTDFHFDELDRRSLLELLPEQFRQRVISPSDDDDLSRAVSKIEGFGGGDKSIADFVIAFTEERISLYRKGDEILEGGRPLTPARERAAITRLLAALKPFREGWLSERTVELIPAGLYEALEHRAAELKSQRIYSVEREKLSMLCGLLGVVLTNAARACDLELQRSCALDFVDSVLTLAGIEHADDRVEHPDRLAALIFPPEDAPPPQ